MMRKSFISAQHQHDKAADFLINESMQNFFLVKSNNTDKFEKSRYINSLYSYIDSYGGSQKYLAKLNMGQSWFTSGGLSFSMVFAAYAISGGALSIGDLVFMKVLIESSYRPLFNMGNLYINFQEIVIEMKDVMNILNTKNEVQELQDAKPLEVKEPSISFKDVNLKLGEKQILTDLNLDLAPGEILIVTGPSGIGKSTLANLLVRFYDVDSGNIQIAGQDIKSCTLNSLRNSVSYCPQNALMFNDTIIHNLVYSNLEKYFTETRVEGLEHETYALNFDKDSIPSEIVEICKQLDLHSRISTFENGYFDDIGDAGQKLSGGERQRLSIARTVLKDAAILIFDEPTNGLDAYNEKRFMELLQNLKKQGKTVIIVTHNLSLSPCASKILCFSSEKAPEIGTHSSLLSDPSSSYSNLYSTFLETLKNSN